jgi:hypothetical protein
MMIVEKQTLAKAETAEFSFQVGLLQLNLHLAEAEEAPAPQRRAHTEAVAQMQALAERP